MRTKKMSNITYKYKVGDRVKFKDKFCSTASCDLFTLAGTTAKITQRVDYGKPTYCIEGHDGVFAEGCFAGLATELINSPYRDEACGVCTKQGPETKCDTEGFKEV
jgi:hypothetical protein